MSPPHSQHWVLYGKSTTGEEQKNSRPKPREKHIQKENKQIREQERKN
jgi:hypothetical protein